MNKIEIPEHRFIQLSAREKEGCDNLERVVLSLFKEWRNKNPLLTKQDLCFEDLKRYINLNLIALGIYLDGEQAAIDFNSLGHVYYWGYFGSSFHFTDIDKILK